MPSIEAIRDAWNYYNTLCLRAHEYWNEWQGSAREGDRRYELYAEYHAKREALAWVLGEGAWAGGDFPAHTVFPPDLKES
jgi:hypothetical protein